MKVGCGGIGRSAPPLLCLLRPFPHVTRPSKTMYLPTQYFMSTIFSYTSESYARTAMSVIDRPCGNVFRSKLKIHCSIKLLDLLHRRDTSNLLLYTYMYFKVDALTFFVA